MFQTGDYIALMEASPRTWLFGMIRPFFVCGRSALRSQSFSLFDFKEKSTSHLFHVGAVMHPQTARCFASKTTRQCFPLRLATAGQEEALKAFQETKRKEIEEKGHQGRTTWGTFSKGPD